MTSKIFRSTLIVTVVVLLCGLGIVMGVLYNYFSQVQVAQLQDELSLAVTATEQYGNAFLENVEPGRFRLTWIHRDGTVLFDTQVAAGTMANHADREEVLEAVQTGSGSSFRYSDTLTEKTIYEAKSLSDGTVLRISASQASAAALMLDMLPTLLLIVVLAILLTAFLARQTARAITEPLNRLDLEHPLNNDTYEELNPLLRRINQQHLQIEKQMETLRRKADEFTQITENMKEGLVLLNSEGMVLSINPTARILFGAEADCIGKSFLTVDRSQQMRDALNAALDKGHGKMKAERSGRFYRFDLSRIESDGMTVGVVVLAFDITEAMTAEQVRREFSANVSHELKTPLQSIIGSAELLENGLVKPEDASRFVGRIRKEATRLVHLVEDIIRLSQLDEGVQLPQEEVDLLEIIREVEESLTLSAREKQVSLQAGGEACRITGVRRLLLEMTYNLCDNAIKYNVPDGSVRLWVEKKNEHTVLSVTDTGIGIPEEHQNRIFERFYRVEKSHSRASGGTGLGLSIVKHSALHHKAKLELHSRPGEGTVVRVIF